MGNNKKRKSTSSFSCFLGSQEKSYERKSR